MHKSLKISLIVLAIILISLFFLRHEINEAYCSTLSKEFIFSSPQAGCYNSLAIRSNNPNLCEKLPQVWGAKGDAPTIAECLIHFGFTNEEFCAISFLPGFKSSPCIFGNYTKPNPFEACNEMSNKYGREYCLKKYEEKFGIKLNDLSGDYCSEQESPNLCYEGSYYVTRDYYYCSKLSRTFQFDVCLAEALVEEDYSMCDACMNDKNYLRNLQSSCYKACLVNLAIYSQDKTFCDMMENYRPFLEKNTEEHDTKNDFYYYHESETHTATASGPSNSIPACKIEVDLMTEDINRFWTHPKAKFLNQTQ
jgi:hypothetical protein